jgi:hypothetical protein
VAAALCRHNADSCDRLGNGRLLRRAFLGIFPLVIPSEARDLLFPTTTALPLRRIRPSNFQFSSPLRITSELLTWLVGNLSGFCFKTEGYDQILHFKPGAREHRVCFVECLTE